MSLREAYMLAHTAQSRLQIAASQSDRSLRFVVGHLMHYESLRLRIVEIEHGITQSPTSSKLAFQRTDPVDHHLQHKPSTHRQGRRSPPPPPPPIYDDDTESDEEDDIAFDDEAGESLALSRFPSATSQKPQQSTPQPTKTSPDYDPHPTKRSPPDHDPPDLESDSSSSSSSSSDDEDEPHSPATPTHHQLHRAVKGAPNPLYATYYEGLCYGHADPPTFACMWDFPPDPPGPARVHRHALGVVAA